jgi:hypothetical protein
LGPADVIIVEAKAQWVLECEQGSIELATITVAAIELKELCLSAPPSLDNLAMPSMSDTFKAVVDAKAVQIDAEDSAKTI